MKDRVLKIVFFLFLSVILCGQALAERVAVSVSIANIRSGPGTGYDVLWQVEKYHPLEIIKKSGMWYYFYDFEDDKGWIHKKLINKTFSVITTKNKCNVRSAPRKDSEILFRVDKGIPFKVIKRKGNWINIQHADGDRGWIYKSLVW